MDPVKSVMELLELLLEEVEGVFLEVEGAGVVGQGVLGVGFVEVGLGHAGGKYLCLGG